MVLTQQEKARRFRALHDRPGVFIIPNPWDGASARILAGLGFEALATSSAAAAATLGRLDGRISRDEALDHARVIVRATDLPVSADLESGFGDEPAAVAETVRLAAEAGLVGCLIEDATGDRARPLFEAAFATERVAAGVAAARALGFPFALTGRTQSFVRGNPDLEEVIRRLQAFEAAGADVLMAPGLQDLDAVRAVCRSVSKPFNFMAGIQGRSFSVAELAAAGVKRISLAASLYCAAMTGLLAAAREVREHGTFAYIDASVPSAEFNAFLET